MAKKQSSSTEPVVAEEPIKPDEQFKMDEGTVAPPSSYVSRRERTGNNAPKTYGARSARDRRAGRAPRGDSPRRAHVEEYSSEVVADVLEHPTITVTEDQLRKEYSYVIADIRSMAILSAGLIAFLVVLAQVLPK